MVIEFVEYDRLFLGLSTGWLTDPEIKKLTLTPDIGKEAQLEWFSTLKMRTDYYIWGILADKKPIGAVGIKHIDLKAGTGEYWGYIGEKDYIGFGIGKQMVLKMCAKASEIGLMTLRLQVAKYNERAYALYKKMGFAISGSNDMVFFMEKKL